MNREDQIFMVARAMALKDGHDADQSVIFGPSLKIRGTVVLPFGASCVRPLWTIYDDLAAAAVDALRDLPEGISR